MFYDSKEVKSENSLEFISAMFESLNSNKMVVYKKDHSVKKNNQEKCDSGWYKGVAYLPNESEGIAQVIYTSGTEGKPKGVLLSHRALLNTARRLIDTMELDDTVKEYIGVPVNYSFGFGRCRAISLVGGSFFLPSNGFNPYEICEMLKEGEINSISAVPTLWRVLFQVEDLFKDVGARVKWIEIGSQFMSKEEKERLVRIFPNAKIYQHYGLSEASRSCFLKVHELKRLDSVGDCTGQVALKISEDGRIQIKGDNIASGLLIDGEQHPATDEDGWLETNDLGAIQNGYLYYLGRADDVINSGGIKLSPELLELELCKLLNISNEIVIFKLTDSVRGEIPALGVLRNSSVDRLELKESFHELLKEKQVSINTDSYVFEIDAIPKTATGKTQRKKLSEDFADTKNTCQCDSPNESESQQIKKVWQEVLGVKEIAPDDTFQSLGGDSLSTLQAIIKMDSLNVPKVVSKLMISGATLREISDRLNNTNIHRKTATVSAKQPYRFEDSTKAVHVIRGLFVILNIIAHWHLAALAFLPPIVSELNKYLSPLYSSGTPGFAIIFGFGLGAFAMPRIRKGRSSLKRLILRNAKILFSGILILAFTRVALELVQNSSVSGMVIANSFYSVIYYYAMAVVIIPIILYFMKEVRHFSLLCILLALFFYSVHFIFEQSQITSSDSPLIQLAILAVKSKYNFFEMSAGVFMGISIGYWALNSQRDHAQLSDISFLGVVLVIASVVLSLEQAEQALWFVWPKGLTVWSWLFYAGIVLFIYQFLIKRLSHISHNSIAARSFNKLVDSIASIGILAFPFFIGHALVIPIHLILFELHIPFSKLIPLSLFLVVGGFYINKVNRVLS